MASSWNVARRSIRVLVSPTPVTFAERRSVLQVLEQYGPVEVFKMTPGYHANFVSVTKEASTASKLVDCSPLTYHIPASDPNGDAQVHTTIADLLDDSESLDTFKAGQSNTTTPSDLPGKAGQVNEMDQPSLAAENVSASRPRLGRQEERQFRLEIFPDRDYQHKFAMLGSPLHQSWPEAYRKDKSFLAATLKQSLPQTMAAKGLAHWLFDVGSNSASKSERKAERLRLKGWMPSKMKD